MHPDYLFKREVIHMESDLPAEERMRYFYDVWLPLQSKLYENRIIDISYSEYAIVIE